jgi:hypothetical protein
MCLDQRHCVEPWHSAMVVAPGSYSPPRDLSFPVVQQRHPIAASADWSHVSNSRDGTATVVLRGPQGGLAVARFGGAKSSPFARLIRSSHRPCRSGEIQWRHGAARSYQFQMQSTDSART